MAIPQAYTHNFLVSTSLLFSHDKISAWFNLSFCQHHICTCAAHCNWRKAPKSANCCFISKTTHTPSGWGHLPGSCCLFPGQLLSHIPRWWFCTFPSVLPLFVLTLVTFWWLINDLPSSSIEKITVFRRRHLQTTTAKSTTYLHLYHVLYLLSCLIWMNSLLSYLRSLLWANTPVC